MRFVWVLVAVMGCGDGQSRPDGGGDGPVAETCPAPCIADAAADLDGTPGGAGGRWRYLEDRRDRTWAAMTATAGAMIGSDPRNEIRRCADEPSAAACQELPGALLVSSSGMASAADPAIEYRSAAAQVIRIALRARVPAGGAEHRVRLYRNSREDVLFTAAAAPRIPVATELVVDALPGDRFLVALEPTGAVGGVAALHLFVSDAGLPFPSTCQLAVPFSVAGSAPAAVDDLCGGELVSLSGSTPAPPLLAEGPFPEQGRAGSLEPPLHYRGTGPLVRSGPLTVQFWVQRGSPLISDEWVFSDLDMDTGGGLGIQLRPVGGGVELAAATVRGTPPAYDTQGVAFPGAFAWHFVRVVHGSDTITICLDGARAKTAPLAGPRASTYPPYLGKNVVWDNIAFFTGSLDDVRVFSAALPCD